MPPEPSRQKIRIRKRRQADLSDIRALFGKLHPHRKWRPGKIRSGSTFLVAQAGGKVVGLAVANWISHGLEPYGILDELIVDPSFRGKGTGRHLIDAALKLLQKQGAEVVFTSPLDRSAASFYLRRGFKPCKTPWLYRSL